MLAVSPMPFVKWSLCSDARSVNPIASLSLGEAWQSRAHLLREERCAADLRYTLFDILGVPDQTSKETLKEHIDVSSQKSGDDTSVSSGQKYSDDSPSETFPQDNEKIRVDDIPLLLAHMKRMNLVELLEKYFPGYSSQNGLSLGNVILVWLSHILSEANYCINHVQEWAMQRIEVMRGCGLKTFEARDMTDNHLADVLCALSSNTYWLAFEQELMEALVRVYGLQKECIRVNTTTISSYPEMNEDGSLQLRLSCDHQSDQMVLASLDPSGMLLTTEVLSGEQAGDFMYLSIITRVRNGLGKEGLLYVGNCNLSALQTRAAIQFQRDFYLCHLSPYAQLQREVDELRKKDIPVKKIYRINNKNERICIAEGYEIDQELTAEVNGQMQTWIERRFLIQSTCAAEDARLSLLYRVDEAKKAIQRLRARKQGKSHVKTLIDIDEAIQQVVKKFRVENFLDITIRKRQVRGIESRSSLYDKQCKK